MSSHLRARLTVPLLTALVAMLAGASGAQADSVIATVDRATPVSAYGSGVLWSQRDPATGGYALWYTDDASPAAPLAVPERGVPFDADLGPEGNGHFLAVYSRCRIEAPFDPLASAGPPDYAKGRGCDLYEYDLTSRHERRITAASSPTASEYLPSVWKDEIAFARVYDDKRDYPYLYTHSRTGHESSRRQPGGQRKACSGHGAARTCSNDTHSSPTAIDLYGRRLAFGWTYQGLHDGPASDLRLDDVQSAAHRRVDEFAGGGLTTIALSWPAFESGELYYGRGCFGDPGGCHDRAALVRYRYSTGTSLRAPIGRGVLWAARAGGRTLVLRDASSYRACRDLDAPDPTTPTCAIDSSVPVYAP